VIEFVLILHVNNQVFSIPITGIPMFGALNAMYISSMRYDIEQIKKKRLKRSVTRE